MGVGGSSELVDKTREKNEGNYVSDHSTVFLELWGSPGLSFLAGRVRTLNQAPWLHGDKKELTWSLFVA